MYSSTTSLENVRRLFNDGFTVRDIAEPLVSFDASTAAAEARDLMHRRDFDVVGVRRQGLVVGYVERDALGEGPCGDYLRAWDDESAVPDTAPLAQVVLGLSRSPRLFVRALGTVGGIVTMSDLQRPPVRMWLFGLVTIVEMRMSGLIEALCPDESWRSYISEARLAKAQELLAERQRRNQSLGLLDCLQISDKGQIIARNEAIRGLTRLESRRKTEEAVKQIESLRNNLAHSQDILACDWDTIVMLSSDVDAVLMGTEQVQQVLQGGG